MSRIVRITTLALAGALIGSAATIQFSGTLGPEVMGATGSGTALVTYDSTAHTLVVSFNFSGLSGPTTVAHIHCCVNPPGTVGVATYPGTFPGFPTGVTSGSYTSPTPIDLLSTASYTSAFLTNFGGGTAAGAEAALIAGLQAGRAYLNVHTSAFPGGEIRDFLSEVPEPGSAALCGGMLAGLAAVVLRRRKSA